MISHNESVVSFNFNKPNFFVTIVICLLLTLLLSFIDIVTGAELTFTIFYLIPITLSVFLSGISLGISFSVLCSIVWIFSDIYPGHAYSNLLIPVWNTLVRFVYFLLHTIMLSRLLQIMAEIQDNSFKDPLTKVYNWRYLEEYTNTLIKTANRNNSKIGIIYLDVDNFKKLNDSYGHTMGDQALITITEMVQKQIRSEDIFARLGGDEFSIVLANCSKSTAYGIINRIKDKVDIEINARGWGISLSIGCIIFSKLTSTINQMVKEVDDLMYTVKENGKNNILIKDQFEQDS